MTDYIVAYVTVASEAEGRLIARTLVEEHLAACVNVIPNVQSFYRWEGQVRHDAELLLIIKSRAQHMARLITRVQELHSYDVPEIIAVDLAEASTGYLSFLRDSLAP